MRLAISITEDMAEFGRQNQDIQLLKWSSEITSWVRARSDKSWHLLRLGLTIKTHKAPGEISCRLVHRSLGHGLDALFSFCSPCS